MAELVAWLANRLRPREGWAAWLLVLAALLCLPAALVAANEALPALGLVLLTGLAAIVGLRLARSRLPAWAVGLLGFLLGLALAFSVVGHLLPPLSLLWKEFLYTFQWLGQPREGVEALPLPFATANGFVWQRGRELVIRLWWWSQTAAGGGTAQDTIFFSLLVAFFCWLWGIAAMWQIYRRKDPLVGLLPGGIATAIVAFFSGGASVFYLIILLFCTLWLVALGDLWEQQARWEKNSVDFAGNMGLELAFVLGPWLLLLLLLASFFPMIYSNPLREAFWRVMEGPWSRVETAAEPFFGPIHSSYPGPGGESGSDGGLPRAHLLGGGPELDETIALYVSTNDPPPPPPEVEEHDVMVPEGPRRYWRGVTFDTYTGSGWKNGPLERQTLPANQPLSPTARPGPELLQQFEVLPPARERIYVANAPARIDHTVETWQRSPGDLVQAQSNADRYTAISYPPQPTIAELRAAPDTLPPDLAERYLALPDTVPRRVLDLADEAAGGAETRYDKAKTIELFLRTYTYTLDLPPPPGDRDVVDYFLFGVQEGYCDYYASSMVVLARAVGVPARLASGYAQGTYDPKTGRWIVTEEDGHTWVEAYFEGIGWVEFEPTAGQPALDRPGGGGEALVLPARPRRAPAQGGFPWKFLVPGLALAALIALAVGIWAAQRRRDLTAEELVCDRQARLLRWGKRLGHPLRDGQTPHEYGHSLGDALHSRGHDAHWSKVRQAAADAPPKVESLTEAFTRARYSPNPIGWREAGRVRDLWARLRRRLWWLWLGATLGCFGHQASSSANVSALKGGSMPRAWAWRARSEDDIPACLAAAPKDIPPRA